MSEELKFKSYTEVESLPEVPEGATVLAEVDGAVKRVPGDGLGGAGGYLMMPSTDELDLSKSSDGLVVVTKNYNDMLKVLEKGGQVYFDLGPLFGQANKMFAPLSMWGYIPSSAMPSSFVAESAPSYEVSPYVLVAYVNAIQAMVTIYFVNGDYMPAFYEEPTTEEPEEK